MRARSASGFSAEMASRSGGTNSQRRVRPHPRPILRTNAHQPDRLVDAVLAEQRGEWNGARRHINAKWSRRRHASGEREEGMIAICAQLPEGRARMAHSASATA
jgi:hypothetical protein